MSTESLHVRTPIARRVGAVFRHHEPALVWLALVGYVALAGQILRLLPGAFADPAQAAFFSWPAIVAVGAAGLAGAALAERAGFPRPLSGWAVSRRALLMPVVGGLAFGAALVALDLATGFTEAVLAQRGMAQRHTGTLPMLLIFSAAAVIVEPVYRLLPLALLQWLVGELLLRGRGRAALFWALALATSLLEPWGQIGDLVAEPGPTALLRAAHAVGFNLFQAALFRRYGFLAAIVARVAFYLVWDVLYVW